MSRATNDAADHLHAFLFAVGEEELVRALQRARDNPHDPAYAVSPQLISQLVKLLKDNGVTAPQGAVRVDTLKTTLLDVDLDKEMEFGGRA
ncbi:hypothetical protein [Brevundimonas nasdae]|uniref:Uncharacterized protein n=1 Tax=Brevundimonas nasdae TaxID=172043 RepID=A0ACD4VLL2_9CAUL|nr:hypothetical protein [Brevundimonas nasdae]WOB78470.1 hypothetical protein PZA08_14375 [Brevundimonas nasdae]